jgi:pyridoxine kinase
MGDHGKLYSVFTPKLQEQMKKLIQKADVITPNYTEACFLLGEPYCEQIEDVEHLRDWLVRLAEFGPSRIVMTGVQTHDAIINIGYERDSDSYCEISNDFIPVRYPGTGDIFASVLAGSLLKGESLPQAMRQAVDFVSVCIQATFQAQTPVREGVLLEAALPKLWQSQNGSAAKRRQAKCSL